MRACAGLHHKQAMGHSMGEEGKGGDNCWYGMCCARPCGDRSVCNSGITLQHTAAVLAVAAEVGGFKRVGLRCAWL
jgi:hypothetical protein